MELSPQTEKPLSFNLVLYTTYLLPVICFLIFGKRQFKTSIVLLLVYSIVFYLLLTFFEDLRDWINQFESLKGLYSNFYTFLEYNFFTSFIFINIASKKVRTATIYLSIAFVVFQATYFLTSKFKSLDSVGIGVETILLFGYVIYFFYEQFKKPTNITIYNHACFWVCVGILIYLGGSFFFYIMADHMTKSEIAQYWNLTYIGEIIKNILFSYSIFLYARQNNQNGLNKKILPNLDMV